MIKKFALGAAATLGVFTLTGPALLGWTASSDVGGRIGPISNSLFKQPIHVHDNSWWGSR